MESPRDEASSTGCGESCGCRLPRRDFLRLTAVAAAGFSVNQMSSFAALGRTVGYVPVDKGRVPELLAKGERAVYRGGDLKYIGMPIGGICAGTVYLGGDGRLWLWDVFNEVKLGAVAQQVTYQGSKIDAGGGANYVAPSAQVHPFAQGFALQVQSGGATEVRPLDATGWKEVSFTGEYPMGFVGYRDPASPVSVDLEAFSPFIPLDPDASELPAVVLRYTVKNDGAAPVRVALGGWMENPVGLRTVKPGEGVRQNRATGSRVAFTLTEPPHEEEAQPARPEIILEDWEKDGFAGWTVTGDAFGAGPADKAKLGGVGGPGRRFAKSFHMETGVTNLQADARTGRLTSREFPIERRYLEFWIGGGNYPKTACLNLVVDGKVVRSATGRQEDVLHLERFDLRDLQGRRAHLEIVDEEKGFWGQIGVGQIALVDKPNFGLREAPDFGDMALAILRPQSGDRHTQGLPAEKTPEALFTAPAGQAEVQAPLPERPRSGVVREMTLGPGQAATVEFAVAWHFPNLTISRLGRVGNHYAARFPSAMAVVDHLDRNLDRLTERTRLWHETWYDSTLPRWFLDRTMGNTATLATMTCVRFENGRFYGWEGVGCCDGTCGHVWQYAQTVGRLFPSLERDVRERVDYTPGVGFHEDTGLIDFRGEYGFGYAADAQTGYILRTLREHQMSPDGEFLRRVYPQMKKALEYLIRQDADEDGILEGRQHNTLDVDLYGPSSWLTSLYLAALVAGEEMADEMGDRAFAARCRTIADRGAGRFNALFWNGDYFIHRLNREEHPESMRIGNGCEIDQVMGQGWAHQIGVRRVVDAEHSKAALRALYRNNFLPDVGPFREEHKPGRWYAVPGEAGLLLCTFPKGDRKEVLGPDPTWASMYFNECWTGTEYEAAGHMVYEGLVEEGMRVTKAVHDRHHPSKRNPWNEIECSDHYARCLAVYGVFTAACGYEYHGPKGHLGFAPRITPEAFRAAFTGAEGWGTYRQRIEKGTMEAGVRMRHGSLRLRTLTLEVPPDLKGNARLSVGGQEVAAKSARDGRRLTLTLDRELKLKESDELVVRVGRS